MVNDFKDVVKNLTSLYVKLFFYIQVTDQNITGLVLQIRAI